MFLQQMKRGRGFRLLLAGLAASTVLGASAMYSKVHASDHDDGETNIKSRNLSLTDLYVFREDWETNVPGDASNLIFVMNTNPRSMPRQQYFFNTSALYNFHVSRRSSRDAAVSGVEDVRFEFSFGAPTTGNQQNIRMQIHRFSGGNIVSTETFANAGLTTPASAPLANSVGPNPIANSVTTANGVATVFAGLREDPFFFDVLSFFKVRGTLYGQSGPAVNAQGGFLSIDQAQDFTRNYNVNAIVLRVPISLLRAGGNETVFDVWETISVPAATAVLQ